MESDISLFLQLLKGVGNSIKRNPTSSRLVLSINNVRNQSGRTSYVQPLSINHEGFSPVATHISELYSLSEVLLR